MKPPLVGFRGSEACPPHFKHPLFIPAAGDDMARVLVVEDNHDLADTFVFLLTGAGHEVRVVFDGLAALSEVERRLPDAILLDIGLPFLDGAQVAMHLRDRYGRSLRLVGCTAFADYKNKKRIIQAGFDVILTKPVPVDELLRSMCHRHVGRKDQLLKDGRRAA